MSATDPLPGIERDPTHGFSRTASTSRLAERIQDHSAAVRKLAALQQAAQQQIAVAQTEVVRLAGAVDELVAMWLPEGSTFEQAFKDDHDGIRSLVEGKS